MGGYIRMDKDLEDDPRVIELARCLALEGVTDTGLAINTILGGLYRLWRYADTHLGRSGSLRCVTRTLADVTHLPLHVLRAFPPEWLIENADGTVTLPGYADKNALLDKESRREQTRKRVEKWRRKQRNNGNALQKHIGNNGKRYDPVTTGTGTGTTGTETGPVGLAASPSPVATGSAAPKDSDTEPLSDDALRLQVSVLRSLHWDDERILAKWARRGMTEEHLHT